MKHSVLGSAIQSFRYVLASQVLVLALGLAKAFLIPLFLGVSNYGYWQIYVFYTAYVGLFTLGFNDGLYLRYGGFEASDLPMTKVRAAVRVYTLFLISVGAAIAWSVSYETDPSRRIAMYLVAANVVVMGLLGVYSLTFQATGQLKRFGIFNAADKLFFLMLLPPLLIFGIDSFLYLAAADLVSKVLVLAALLLMHKELFVGVGEKLGAAWREVFANVMVGSQLMIANVSGMLVLGMGRFIIEYFDKLENYAYYAFGVSMTNLALVAITALSVVIYPTLRRLPAANYLGYYNDTNRRLFLFNIIMLAAYFPVVHIIELMLPKYAPMIPFLNVLFAITVLQGKMQLLNNTYYKVLRLESAMLMANLSSVLIVTVLSLAGYLLTRSIAAIAWAALATMMYRVYSSELYLRRRMGDQGIGIAPLETLALVLFLASTSLLTTNLAQLAFAVVAGAYLVYARRELIFFARLAWRKAP